MWSRTQLKDKARTAFKRNYWKVVLVSALLILFGGASAGSSYTYNFSNGFNQGYNSTADFYDDYSGVDDYYDDYYSDDLFENDSPFTISDTAGLVSFVLFLFLVLMVVFVNALAVSLLLQAFIFNPLEVGTKRFFFKNLNDKANVKEIAFAYDNHYMNVVKTLFFRDLYITLWSLLFVIPGIVKSYEYKMMPYLLAENPSISKEQAFALSKQMMDGQKWKTFVLDLSFIGWEILSSVTLGIFGIFYVTPYRYMTHAALYESLCYQRQWTSYNQSYTGSTPYAQPQDMPDMIVETDTTEDNNNEV